MAHHTRDHSTVSGPGDRAALETPTRGRLGSERMIPTVRDSRKDTVQTASEQQWPAKVVEGPGVYYMGIVDILQEFNWWKKMERFFKMNFMCQNEEGMSVQPPDYYAQRFMKRIREIVITHEEFIGGEGRRRLTGFKAAGIHTKTQTKYDLMADLPDSATIRARPSAHWKAYVNESGKEYYYNTQTKKTTWVMPEEMALSRLHDDKKVSTSSAQTSTSRRSTAGAVDLKVLSLKENVTVRTFHTSDWKEYASKNDGKPYYYNTKTKKTQWERPIELGEESLGERATVRGVEFDDDSSDTGGEDI